VFDRRRLPQAEQDWFTPNDSADSSRGGRGAVWRIETPAGRAVLRHYRRGGAVARLSRDRYLWTGRERTRSFREFRLLAALDLRGLPVPAPLAARYLRCDALRYTADLLTLEIADARTLHWRRWARPWPASIAPEPITRISTPITYCLIHTGNGG
jgi:3-deoxy-D-manno-octulosonic acid kinase